LFIELIMYELRDLLKSGASTILLIHCHFPANLSYNGQSGLPNGLCLNNHETVNFPCN